MDKWFYFIFFIFLLAIRKLVTSPLFPNIQVHIIFGFIGLLLLLFNWTRHAFYSTLRSSMPRQKKIKYANLSKQVRPFHRWAGTIALFIVIIHMILVFNTFNFHLKNYKMWSGLITLAIVLGIVISGWLRLFWPSGPKRYTHLFLGISMFWFIILHLIL